MTGTTRAARALAALTVLVAVIAGVPVLLAAIGTVPHSIPSLHAVARSVTAPDDTGQYFRIGGAAIAWIAWAYFTLCTLKEIAATLRFGLRPRLPVRGVGRLGPAALVAAIAVSFAAAPVTSMLTAPRAFADTPSPSGHVVVQSVTMAESKTPAPPRYQVKRYDTLWSIAQQHLPGDPAQRYRDIKHLNPSVVGADNEIAAGATLVMPADARGLTPGPAPEERDVTVRTGDTLSSIAAHDGIKDWNALWPANKERIEPGGEQLTNPDHIEPGWTITIPARMTPAGQPAVKSGAPAEDHPTPSEPTRPADPPAVESDAIPVPTQHAVTAAPSPTSQPQTEHDESPKDVAVAPRPWAELFTGGGALLAAGLLAILIAGRRRQFRNRRPGRMIRTAAPELVPVEKALRAYGPNGIADVEFLDRALRGLSTATAHIGGELPDILAARVIDGRLELRLRAPHLTQPPTPWTADASGLCWTVRASDDPSVRETVDRLAPYPALATIGQDADDGIWLVDLEAAAVLTLTGDPDRCADLIRFIAAELAVNAWSDHVTVTVLGLGDEVVALNPERLHVTENVGAAVRAVIAQRSLVAETSRDLGMDVLGARMRGVDGDTFMPHVLLLGPEITATEALEPLLAGIDPRWARSTTAFVLHSEPTGAAGRVLHVAADGSVSIPSLGVELVAQQLPEAQVDALSALIHQSDQIDDAPIPAAIGTRPLAPFTHVSGALLPEVTRPRDMEGTPRSVLPRADEDYLLGGATTPEDLHAIAPRVDDEVSAAIIAADPTLDTDLAEWRDPDSVKPKLILLGPVELIAHGEKPTKRISYYTEVAAFIATRDHGATAEQVAAAFDVTTTSIYSRINSVRAWLGTNPATGKPYLPSSTRSGAGQARGVGVYEMTGVAVDADLFTRLRARGQALQGGVGIAYLEAALSLVAGRPFDQLRPGGYGWLAETPLDHYLTSGIVDTAHTVHLHHLQAGDLKAARTAAELGQLVAPYEDIPRLDLVAVMNAEGLHAEADRYLRDEICNRSDDGGVPIDLPDRTEKILRQRQWLNRAV